MYQSFKEKQGRQPLWGAYLALTLSIASSAFSAIFVSLANAPGAVTGAYRMSIASLLITAPFLYSQQTNPTPLPKKFIWIAIFAGLFFGADLIFWNTGILISGAANPTLMGNTASLWVGLFAYFFLQEKLTNRFWIGLLISLIGAAIIIGVDALNQVGLGTLMGLLAGFFYAGYYILIQQSRRSLSALSAFWVASLSAAIFLILASLLLKQPLLGYSSFTYLNFFGLAFIVQICGQLSITYALGHLPASIVSPTMLAQPILTALLAIPILGQPITLVQSIGGLIVLFGIYLVHTRSKK